jgi:hypothetical protein
MDCIDSAVRQRRAADTARWRERLRRGAAVYPVEVDGSTFDLMERFAGLKATKMSDRQAVCRGSRQAFAACAGRFASGNRFATLRFL